MHGFVREELPLVCQKCNPAMTRRDPALRGKLLRQKCVSVGAPSCPASLSLSLSLSISLSLCLFFSLFCSLPLPQHSPLSPYTSIYCTLSYHTGSLSPFCPSSLMFTSSFFSALSFFYSKLHSCITQHQDPPHPRPSHPRHRRLFFLPCEGAEALLSGDRSPPTEKINTQSPATDSLQFGLQSRTSGTRERENEGRK